MPAYRLHCFAQSGNAYKVALYLNCAGLEWEPVFVDYMAGMTRDPAWRARVNPMGEVPVLEADGKRLTQSGAILTWLAEKTGKMAPRTEDERYEALRWILFDNHKFTSYLATYRFMRSFAPQAPDPAVMAFLKTRIDGALGIVNEHLVKTPFLLGSEPTIADFSLAGYVFYPKSEHGYDFETSHKNIFTWTQRLKALPGWKDPYDMLPGERIAPRWTGAT
jgi:glutathione S-transferase